MYLGIAGLHAYEDLTYEVNGTLGWACASLLFPFNDEHKIDHLGSPRHVEQDRLLALSKRHESFIAICETITEVADRAGHETKRGDELLSPMPETMRGLTRVKLGTQEVPLPESGAEGSLSRP